MALDGQPASAVVAARVMFASVHNLRDYDHYCRDLCTLYNRLGLAMKSLLEGRTLIDIGMTNFDSCIEPGLAEVLQAENTVAQYAGYHFCAYVIAKDNGFMCQVWTHGSLCREDQEETLEDIMDEVRGDFGGE